MLNEAYWGQQEVYLAAAAAGRKPSPGERVKALLAARGAVPTPQEPAPV
jgi:hypothetical protein